MKTPKTIALLAVPAVLAAAIVSATGAFAKAPAHQSAGGTTTLTSAAEKLSVAAAPAAPAAPAPDVAPAAAAPAAEPAGTAEATEPAGTETDAAGGHADDPNDPNADHQFDGEE